MPGPSSASLGHRVQDLAVGGVTGILRVIPEPVALLLGAAVGWLAGSVFRIRRRTIDENLARAFPDRPAEWRARVAAGVFPHVAREAITLLRMSSLSPAEIRDRTQIERLELLEEAMKLGRGVLVLTGHFGNWEIGGGAVALGGFPIDVVVQTQSNPLIDARLRRSREALGLRVVYRQDAPREVLRSLRGGRVAALVADQNVRSGGVFVDFFGIPASTARGPALFALRTGAPVLVATAVRLPGWRRARYRVRFRKLDPALTGEVETDVRRLIGSYLGALEEAIEEAPEQYFWLHKRWKTRPREEEPERSGTEEPFGTGPV